MKISVKVKTNSKIEKIEKLDDTHFAIAVKASPVEGRANDAILKALANYFGVSNLRVKLVSGKKSKNKVFEIL